jgi:cytochrome P450
LPGGHFPGFIYLLQTTNENVMAQYDLFAPEALLNPYSLYKRMREEDPVHYSESFGYWVLTRYQDVEAALQDERLSADRTAFSWDIRMSKRSRILFG